MAGTKPKRVWLSVLLVGLLQLASSQWHQQVEAAIEEPAAGSPVKPAVDTNRHQSNEQSYYQATASSQPYTNGATYYGKNNNNQKHTGGAHQKCARQSIILARQMLAHELNYLNHFNSFWFSDLDRDELIEGQKHSLSNIVMSGAGSSLLNSEGQPLIELESSYFRQPAHQPPNAASNALSLRLLRKHQDKCHLNLDRGQFSYTVGLSIGPIEHHMDVIYNLPKDLQLSQPMNWRYGQVTIQVPKMHYEVSFKQAANYKLDNSHDHHHHNQRGASSLGPTCPLEVSDVTYLASSSPSSSSSGASSHSQYQQQANNKHSAHGQAISITTSGLAFNNQTQLQIERLFDDYTRPTVSHRLRQMLKFYLNSKTFPLAAANATPITTTTTTTNATY